MSKRSLKNERKEMHVAIVGLGPSSHQYVTLAKGLGGRHRVADQVWAINAYGGVIDCDLVVHMDDVRIQEIRAAAKPDGNIAAMLEWMRSTRTPVLTSRAHPDYPALFEMPVEAMLNELRFDYFNSTAAWAVGYAIFKGATKITCYGMDFTYPNSHDAEKGRACVEFWLGVAATRGIKIGLAKGTTLMDAWCDRQERLYGYDTRRVLVEADAAGVVKVGFEEITALPTAEEIEHRYDHSRHPNAMVDQ